MTMMVRTVRALWGALLLAAGLLGIPAGLLLAGRVFFPSLLTNPADLWATLNGNSASVFIAVIAGAGLVLVAYAWVAFTVSVTVEVGARLRRVHTPQLPTLGWAQALAALVLGLILLGSPATSGTAQAFTGPTPSPAVVTQSVSLSPAQLDMSTVTATPTGTALTTTAPTPAPAPAPAGAVAPTATERAPSITTVRGDSLWALSEAHLGDGMRWRQVAELNAGRVMADGEVFDVDRPLQAGWQLLLPADATGVSATTQAPGLARDVVVAPGDTLSEIAQTYTGDAANWDALATATVTVVQSDGRHLIDPDEIAVGWTVVVPVTDTAAAPAAPISAAPARAPAAAPAPALSVSTPVPSQAAPTSTPAPGPASPAASAVAGAAGGTAVSDTEVSAGWGPLDELSAVGGLLAAGVLAGLGTRRALARRRRRPGQRFASQDGFSPTELSLRATEDPATVQLLDAALRTWSSRSAGGPVPDVIGAVIGEGTIMLLLAEPATPSSPFVAGPSPTLWLLDRTDTVEHDRSVVAPFPTLVTIGHTAAGENILIDLERAGAMTLQGNPEDVVDVLSAMAIELAGSDWADHLDVTLVGLPTDVVTHLSRGRLRHAGTVDEVLDRMERHHAEMLEVLAEEDAASAVDARVRHVAEDVWIPEVLLTASPVTAAQQARLHAISRAGANTNLAAVITAATDGHRMPGEWVITVPASGTTTVPVLGATVELQRLTHAARNAIVADMTAPDDAELVEGPDAALIPADPTHVVTLAAATTTDLDAAPTGPTPAQEAEVASLLPINPGAPLVHVLRPVPEVVGVPPYSGESPERVLELVVLMALRPGLTRVQVAEFMGTRGVKGLPWADNTCRARLSQAKAWLGADPSGADYVLRASPATGYRMSATVETSWAVFGRLADRGLAGGVAGLHLLDAALALVGGDPLSGVPLDRYEFPAERQEWVNRIADVAHAAAVLHLQGDARKARAAALVGLGVDRANETLFRDLFRAEFACRNAAGIRAAAQRLRTEVDRLGVEMEADSIALLHELLSPAARPARAAS
jgi:hypothetical protein